MALQDMDSLTEATSPWPIARARPSNLTANDLGERSDRSWQTRAEEIFESRQHYDRLLRYAAGCIRNSRLNGIDLGLDPEDLVHHALIVMLEGRLSWYDDINETISCLITTIRHEFRNQRRKMAKRADPAWQARLAKEFELRDAEDACMIRLDVLGSINRLQPTLRETAVSCLLGGQHPKQYAIGEDRCPKTVRNRLGLAKAALRRELAAYSHQAERS